MVKSLLSVPATCRDLCLSPALKIRQTETRRLGTDFLVSQGHVVLCCWWKSWKIGDDKVRLRKVSRSLDRERERYTNRRPIVDTHLKVRSPVSFHPQFRRVTHHSAAFWGQVGSDRFWHAVETCEFSLPSIIKLYCKLFLSYILIKSEKNLEQAWEPKIKNCFNYEASIVCNSILLILLIII